MDLRRVRARQFTDWAGRNGRSPMIPKQARCRGNEFVVLAKDGSRLSDFRFEDRLRADAATAVAKLKDMGFQVQVISGDREIAVRPIAAELDVPWLAAALPGDKTTHIAALEASGRKVLMVGDGLNDAPALAAAHGIDGAGFRGRRRTQRR